MKRLLWLDDVRVPTKEWIKNYSPIGPDVEIFWVKNYNEFINWITANHLPDGICFDHDLGYYDDPENEKTGYDCAYWLVNYCMCENIELPEYNIQSSNPVGKENIDSLLKSYIKYLKNI